MHTFEELEAKGLVRFRTVPDHEPYDMGEGLDEAQTKELQARIDYEGVWGVIGEAKCSHCGNWEQVDSCWGFVGYDWRDSGYDSGIKAECVRFIEERGAKS